MNLDLFELSFMLDNNKVVSKPIFLEALQNLVDTISKHIKIFNDFKLAFCEFGEKYYNIIILENKKRNNFSSVHAENRK
jgi:hypothetical protein